MLWTTSFAMMIGAWASLSAHDPAHEHTHGASDFRHQDAVSIELAPREAGDGHSWFKGNLHTHTLWSDGDQFPEIVADWYVEHGYHFLALSDHNVLSRGEVWIDAAKNAGLDPATRLEQYRARFGEHWVETRQGVEHSLQVRLKPLEEFRHLFERAGRFLMIESEEITASRSVHVNATNLAEFIEPRKGADVEETIRLNVDAVVEQSEALGRAMLPHLNHPNWQWAVRAEDMIPIENLRFFEIYNGHRGVNNHGEGERVGLERLWDIVLTKRLGEHGLGIVHGLAVDDAHHYEGSRSEVARPGRGWVVVRSRFLTPHHIVTALQAGDFYASTGVELRSFTSSADALAIEVEPSEGATYTIEFIGTRTGYDPSSEPVLDAEGKEVVTTRRYSDDIGVLLERVEGPSARYVFRGDELYVRARITSSELHPNPFAEGERRQAWVQPVLPGR